MRFYFPSCGQRLPLARYLLWRAGGAACAHYLAYAGTASRPCPREGGKQSPLVWAFYCFRDAVRICLFLLSQPRFLDVKDTCITSTGCGWKANDSVQIS